MSIKKDTSATRRIQPRQAGDYLRVLYKRRGLAGGAFVLAFLYLATTSLRKTPLYEASTQLLIEKESRGAASSSSVPQDSGPGYDDDFYQTHYKMLQSRANRLAHAGVPGPGDRTAGGGASGAPRPLLRICVRAAGWRGWQPGLVHPRRSCRQRAMRPPGSRAASTAFLAG
jgi:hypothetical protein